jgi:hypothetical protein
MTILPNIESSPVFWLLAANRSLSFDDPIRPRQQRLL